VTGARQVDHRRPFANRGDLQGANVEVGGVVEVLLLSPVRQVTAAGAEGTGPVITGIESAVQSGALQVRNRFSSPVRVLSSHSIRARDASSSDLYRRP
jgi:hypothetical protein